MKRIFSLTFVLLLAACATSQPGPDAFASAERAIAAAEAAGADEHAPVEMRFAREKLDEARLGVERRQYDVSFYLIEQAEINAELAIEKSRAAVLRREVNEARRSNEVLGEELRETFGEAFE